VRKMSAGRGLRGRRRRDRRRCGKRSECRGERGIVGAGHGHKVGGEWKSL